MEKDTYLQISERLCICSDALSKGPVPEIEHQIVFFLTQKRIGGSGPVLHPGPRNSSTRTGVVENPARAGDSSLLDICTDSIGKGKMEKKKNAFSG